MPASTVTSCDLVAGRLVAVLDLDAGVVYLTSQTFGPLAYTALVLQAMVCLFFATAIASGQTTLLPTKAEAANQTRPSGNANDSAVASTAASVAAAKQKKVHAEEARRLLALRSASAGLWLSATCALFHAIHGIPFVTRWDEAHFACAIVMAALLAVEALAGVGGPSHGAEACVYALVALSDAMYRCHENPYAGIVCALLLVRQWQRYLNAYRRSSGGSGGGQQASAKPKEQSVVATTAMMRMRRAASSHNVADGATPTRKTTGSSPSAVNEEEGGSVLRRGVRHAECLFTTLMLYFSAEVGVAPQCDPDVWPFYCGAALYVTFSIAHYHALRTLFLDASQRQAEKEAETTAAAPKQ